VGKIIFWAVLIIGGLLIARILARQNAGRRADAGGPARTRPPRAAPSTAQSPEAMVRCAHCGIHMPRSDAVLSQGHTWCSSEHARLGVRP